MSASFCEVLVVGGYPACRKCSPIPALAMVLRRIGGRVTLEREESMFASCGDEAAGAVVGVFDGSANRDDDWQAAIDAIARSDAAARRSDKPHVCIFVLHANTPVPPAIWRKRMADANRSLQAERYHFAVVCPNSIHRRVLTAILWLTGSRSGHRYTACSTFEEAAPSIRSETAGRYPELESLYERAAAQLAAAPPQARVRTS